VRTDPRSLRYRALGVVVFVVVLPVIWVWVAGLFESGSLISLRRTLYDAAAEGVVALDDPDPAAALEAVARRHHVWLRALSADDAPLGDWDHADTQRWLQPVTDPFYGPDGVPHLVDSDADEPPLPRREEVLAATAQPAARCRIVERGLLMVCSVAQRAADGRLVHVQRGSPRLVRSLYDQRFQLAALSLVVLVVGILAALWLGWRMVGPIEQLRDQVVQRTRGPVSTEPVVLDRTDELGELATAFNQLLEALDARNKSNAGFAADLAHELKNPVAAVRAAAEALAGERPVEGRRRERLQRVLADSSERMAEVVDRFLDLARAEAGLPDAEREPVALRDLVEALVEPLRGDERYDGVRFEVSGPPARVLAAPERLETALRNLLANAAEFAGEDGAVTITLCPGEGEVALAVADTGPGIAPDDLPRLFDRYFTTREGGTGLGLPLTKAIVEAHGGRIEAESAPEGAIFTVTLPTC
jgi:two-component system sensor histidine kinase ChvG